MNPHLQQILHDITVRITKLEEAQKPQRTWEDQIDNDAFFKSVEAQPKHDCTRSHPHEEMSKGCELRTEIARLRNQLAQRTWVGLTEEEINEVFGADIRDKPSGELRFIRAIEAKLKEKNT